METARRPCVAQISAQRQLHAAAQRPLVFGTAGLTMSGEQEMHWRYVALNGIAHAARGHMLYGMPAQCALVAAPCVWRLEVR